MSYNSARMGWGTPEDKGKQNTQSRPGGVMDKRRSPPASYWYALLGLR
jgi:hypothetical protein